MNKHFLTFAVLLTVLTAGGYFAIEYLESNYIPLQVFGNEGHTVSEFVLTDQHDNTFNSEEYQGKIWIVNYFFTSCPVVCPKVMRNIQSIHNVVRSDDHIEIFSFTVDPKRDNPERLLSYSERFNLDYDSWHFLTGEKKELYSLARNSFLLSATEGGGGELDFIHSENIALIDPKGQIRAFVNGTAANADSKVLEAVEILEKEFDL